MDLSLGHLSSKTNSLGEVQNLLKSEGISALLVRATDKYFNEYVPRDKSVRAKLTGFDGSMGDAIITVADAHLFVDGRYGLQAQQQATGFTIHVVENAQSIESFWLNKLPSLMPSGGVLAYDPGTVDLSLYEKMSHQALQKKVKLDPIGSDLFTRLLGDSISYKGGAKLDVKRVPLHLAGESTREKLKRLQPFLTANDIQGFLAVKLDDIAWLANMRGYYFPFQSTLPGIACVFHDRLLFGVALDSPELAKSVDADVEIVKEHELFQVVRERFSNAPLTLGIDARETSKAHEIALLNLNINNKRIENPIAAHKAIKNEKELLHLRSAFEKADHVVYQTQNFVIDSFEKGTPIHEVDVDHCVKEQFKKSGAEELSFRPICAGGKNGAIIHYGTPSGEQTLSEGSLFLLDTGGYYEGGYATDLTRTFLAAKKSTTAKPWQKEMFTLVLRASIRGLSARFKRGTLGMQLDAMVRAPLWQVGLDFAHGTGHGVGINVHEFPPRIGPASTTPLQAGQVFSIEPGLYFEALGGVRIENLVTIVPDDNHPNFLRVLPLTFCPFDERLIEYSMLDAYEKEFLAYYKAEWQNPASWPNLPPLPSCNFRNQI